MQDIKEVNQLIASDGKKGDSFSASVAVSDDGLVAMVGAHHSSTKAYTAGKVYTYSRATIDDNWKEVSKLTANDGKEYDFFGCSVALSSDGLVAIVGGHGNSNAGKVYTYSRDTIRSKWKEVNQLTASDGKEHDNFGISVSLSGNGLVSIVGVFNNKLKAKDAGKVYTYSRDTIDDEWVEVNQLVASDGKTGNLFGTSVALSSDGLVAMVGMCGNITKAYRAGKVYTYSRDTIHDDWKEVNQLLARDGKPNDRFGVSLTVSPDGLVAIVGAGCNSYVANNAGKVYVYTRDTTDDDWKEVNQLVASDGQPYNFFGTSVALSGNRLVALVGASGNTNKAINAGKVYTYTINTNSK